MDKQQCLNWKPCQCGFAARTFQQQMMIAGKVLEIEMAHPEERSDKWCRESNDRQAKPTEEPVSQTPGPIADSETRGLHDRSD